MRRSSRRIAHRRGTSQHLDSGSAHARMKSEHTTGAIAEMSSRDTWTLRVHQRFCLVRPIERCYVFHIPRGVLEESSNGWVSVPDWSASSDPEDPSSDQES